MSGNPTRVWRIHRKVQLALISRAVLIAATGAFLASQASARAPEAQEPKPEAPAAQTPPSPAPTGVNVPLPPPPSTATDYAKDAVLDLRYWLVRGAPQIRRKGGNTPDQVDLRGDIGGKMKSNLPWINLGIPVKHGNRLWFSYFETKMDGGSVSTRDLTAFDFRFSAGAQMYNRTKIRNVKLSFDYLTYPAPPHAIGKWQFKTLWEVQVTNIKSEVESTILQTMTDGSVVDTGSIVSKSKVWVLPTIGAAFEGQPAKGVNVVVKGSGFYLPGRKYIYDTEARLSFQVKHLEVLVGYKKFFISMGSSNEQYFRTGLHGPFGGLAWHF